MTLASTECRFPAIYVATNTLLSQPVIYSIINIALDAVPS